MDGTISKSAREIFEFHGSGSTLHIRTSTGGYPSSFTDEQRLERQRGYEARLYRETGKIVINEGDCGDNVIVLAWFRNLVQRRFG